MIKLKQISRHIIIYFLLFTSILASSPLFTIIQEECKSYKLPITFNMMNLVERPDGSTELNLNIISERNKFDTNMLVGFYASGKGILETDLNIKKVNIYIKVKYKNVRQIIVSAQKKDILKYVNNEISYSDFINKINYKYTK